MATTILKRLLEADHLCVHNGLHIIGHTTLLLLVQLVVVWPRFYLARMTRHKVHNLWIYEAQTICFVGKKLYTQFCRGSCRGNYEEQTVIDFCLIV